ncbi:MAG: 5'/3'-nucleotidase SurE [Corallococcus sp.]|nr:5'/3'-nucleotidase SurE [Corallococcus sp.]
MRILITNDDGIEAEGIKILAEWAKTVGEVFVVAPQTQQSGKSHAITIHNPFEVNKVDFLPDVEAYAINSTPVDCVRFATLGLKQHFDLVLSGINKGYNLGEDILYSGTVGAIFETSLRGLNGIALSTEYTSFETAKLWLDKIYGFFTENNLFAVNNIYNVNIPLNAKDIVVTRQGGAYFTDDFVDLQDGTYHQKGYCIHDNKRNLELDTDATICGYVSVTPMTCNRSDAKAFEILANKVKRHSIA